MKFSQDQLALINRMIQTEARRIATEVYNTLGTQFAVPKVPFHIHNGVDSPLINAQLQSGTITGNLTVSGTLSAGNGATGTSAGHVLTITNGIVTNIV